MKFPFWTGIEGSSLISIDATFQVGITAKRKSVRLYSIKYNKSTLNKTG